MAKQNDFLRAAARCWQRAGYYDRAAERYARAEAWAEAGRCLSQAGRPVDAAGAYARAGEPIHEARQWLASQWPERARRPYRRALASGLGAAAEVEARLGLGEIDLASERAFVVAPEGGRSVDALRSLARLAAARGRPDLAARAWQQAIAWGAGSAGEVFEDWQGASPWNRSLGWRRPVVEAGGWPSRAFREVRLESVWEEKLGNMMYGNRGLAWSADGRRFAAAKIRGDLILGELTGREVRHQAVKVKAIAAAFVPESDSVLVGCRGGEVVRVNASGGVEDVEALKISTFTSGVTFSPRGDRLAVTGGPSSVAILRVWSRDSQGPREMLWEKSTQENATTNPSCAWSPDGRTLAWCPGPWSGETVANDLYLFSDAGTRCVSAAHENGVNGIAFSPGGRHLVTASLDRTLALRDARTGETVAPPWNCAQRPETAVFHPHAALMAAGGPEDLQSGYKRPSRLYLFRFSQGDPPHFEVIQENATETGVCSVAFSPGGEHLLMSTRDRLSLFRVHLA